MIVIVDFDGTLATGNKSHITLLEPNTKLINYLIKLKKEINPTIKVVTARGGKNNLTEQEKIKSYYNLIDAWLKKHKVPFDEISFNKVYGHVYIDDMTISQNEEIISQKSPFTKNKLIFTNEKVIKYAKSSLFEHNWYGLAKQSFNVPEVLFCNDECIITERIKNTIKPTVNEIITILNQFKSLHIKNYDFITYKDNLESEIQLPYLTEKARNVAINIPESKDTFFHGDLSTTNVLINSENNKTYLIDPNYKSIFGNYLTDAGKSYFSFIAFEKDFNSANKIKDAFGDIVLHYAVCEGLRVCKYNPKYVTIVNNIADLI